MRKNFKVRQFSLLMLVAFMMNAIVPFFAIYSIPSAQAASLQSTESEGLFGGYVFICTADGFKWVKSEDIGEGTDHPQPHPEYECALCYVAAHGMKHLSPSYSDAFDISYHKSEADIFPANVPFLIPQGVNTSYPSRAPPASL